MPNKKLEKMANEIFKIPDEQIATNNDKKVEKVKKNCEMNKCIFGNEIKIHDVEPMKHKVDWLKGHISIQITGRSGCGKSRLLCKIIPLISNLSHIVLFSMVDNPSLYDAIEGYCDNNDIIYLYENDPLNGYELIENLIAEKDPTKNALVIFDDFTTYSKSPTDPYNRLAILVNSQCRNYGIGNIMITQTPLNIKTGFSNNTTTKITFPLCDTYSIQRIKADYQNTTGRSDFDTIHRLISKKNFSWMMVSHGRVYIYLHNEREPIFKEIIEQY
jgi:hypothetical protein